MDAHSANSIFLTANVTKRILPITLSATIIPQQHSLHSASKKNK